ncbi:hypothetical protein N0V88_007620 [Collariella sp. IMI 366227]|nr:hypothetical protein N0V88_007620 [Collariella sp. IMI 366227]
MKTHPFRLLLAGLLADIASSESCPDYSLYSQARHEPFSSGKHDLPYQRPAPACRTFSSFTIESLLTNMSSIIADPDLYRLFENTYPNTLDTAIRWRGHAANNTAEELTFLITGDIDAMWLRDSANQLQSYLPILEPDGALNNPNSIASLYRGVINLQARYLLTSPYCNSFQPPPESGLRPSQNTAATTDTVFPPYDPNSVFECKYELDSLAAFLQISVDYYEATHDATFFASFHPYRFTRQTTRQTETLANDGLGSPVKAGTGLIRSAFRPSDDATMFQFLVPANMMFARYMGEVDKVYAYEVDGFGSAAVMDDANIPSLLAAPVFGYLANTDPVYQRTRKRLLNEEGNPYYMKGSVISGIGGPHAGPGMAWPMASIVRILTSDDDEEIVRTLKEILGSTDGLGLIHESVNSNNASQWTRQWFSWANGLFGQMILDLRFRKPHILEQSFQ